MIYNTHTFPYCDLLSQGLPVINVRYGNFGEALDILHEYVLMCIQVRAVGSARVRVCVCVRVWGG